MFGSDELLETDDIVEIAKMTVSTSIRHNTIRGYIGWSSCDNICMDMHGVLDMCEAAFKQKRYMDALAAATYVLVSGVKLASYADSSSGMLTDVVICAFELIELCTNTIALQDIEMRTQALALIIKESKKKAFDGWDSWRYELLEKAICLCDDKMAVKLEKVLDVFGADNEDADYNMQYDKIVRYKLHRHLKGADATKAELYANLHIRELRLLAVKDAVANKEFEEAEKLCLERIKAESEHYYRRSPEDWNNVLFDVYVEAELIDKQIEQAKKILFMGNEKFWDVLKRIYQSQDIWEEQRTILLDELKNCKYVVCYRSVLVDEGEKELLLESISEKPADLFYYGNILVKDYPDEIFKLCADDIREKCSQATNRRLYKKVCKDLLQLIKWKGNSVARELVEEFKAKYPRRPALLDELQKVERKL